MLEGTDLSSAYSSIMNPEAAISQYDDNLYQEEVVAKPKPTKQYNDNAITQQLAAIKTIADAQYQQKPAPPPQQRSLQQNNVAQNNINQQYDVSVFNKQFEQEQKINNLVNELKKQKTQQQVPQVHYQPPMYNEESYWDKMGNRKKDVFKFIHSGLIILFAISLHYIIDFVLKNYLQTHDVSHNREIVIRILYPIGILFVAWNIIAFLK